MGSARAVTTWCCSAPGVCTRQGEAGSLGCITGPGCCSAAEWGSKEHVDGTAFDGGAFLQRACGGGVVVVVRALSLHVEQSRLWSFVLLSTSDEQQGWVGRTCRGGPAAHGILGGHGVCEVWLTLLLMWERGCCHCWLCNQLCCAVPGRTA